jgi:hypothetical protein
VVTTAGFLIITIHNKICAFARMNHFGVTSKQKEQSSILVPKIVSEILVLCCNDELFMVGDHYGMVRYFFVVLSYHGAVQTDGFLIVENIIASECYNGLIC